MISLHNAVIDTKKGAILFVTAIIAITILMFIVNIIKGFLVAPPPGPSMCYGKLPTPSFPQVDTPHITRWSINTLTGTLPTFSDRIVVPKINSYQPSLVGLEEASQSAQQLEYNSEAIPVSSTDYEWVKYYPFQKTLRINVITDDFSVESNFWSDPTVLSGANLPDGDTATSLVTNFLNTITPLPNDVDNNFKIYPQTISDGTLVNTQDSSTEQIMRVDLHQNPINNCYVDSSNKAHGCNIFYPNYPNSSMSFFVAGGQENEDDDSSTGQIVQANYYHRNIDSPTCPNSGDKPTYSLRTTQSAYEDLQKGNAYIAQSDNSTNVTITNVELGYYLGTDSTQQYLVPVYVFEGNNGGFTAYVPALSN